MLGLTQVNALQDAMLTKTDSLIERITILSEKGDQLKQLLDDLGPIMDDISNDIDFVTKELAGGVTADEATGLIARLQGVKDKASAIGGKVDSTPIPPTV
jgi:hypothetical protein